MPPRVAIIGGGPAGLIAADVLAYQSPLYQVLGLDSPTPTPSPRCGELRSVGDILRAALGSTGGAA